MEVSVLSSAEPLSPTIIFLAIAGVAIVGAVVMVLTTRKKEKLGWHFPGSATEHEYVKRKQGRRDDEEPPHAGAGPGSPSSL